MFDVHLDAPCLGKLERKYLNEAVDSNYVSVVGPFVPEFEKKFAEYVNVKHAVSLQSGTAAIHIALHELGISHGDEVIVPALTFVATINPVLYVGAKPVIVDVEPETWNIVPKEIKKAITKSTKAIIPVHLYGNPCDMDEILNLAQKFGIHVIEDATESLGAIYKGQQTGTMGSLGCFSFNGNKLITTGGGGMIVSDSHDRMDHIKFLVNQARDESQGYYHPEMGFNYRMTNIEAALGLSQLVRINEFLDKKRKFREIYQEILGELSYIKFQREYDDTVGSWWLTCVKVDKEMDLDELIIDLKEKGVPSRRVFLPVNEMPYLREFSCQCPNALEIYKKGLCLPSSALNEETDIREVAFVIRHLFEK